MSPLESDVRVLIVPNTGKAKTAAAARELASVLADEGHEVVLIAEDAVACDLEDLGIARTDVGVPDMAVALGGDGTIIRTVHVLGEAATPILGVNFGRLGFMTGASSETLTDSVRAALAGTARTESRMTLHAAISMEERDVGHYEGLNEVFVGRIGASRVVDLSVKVNGHDVATFTCDGLIVATSTGSTAYALSAGGPIVSPDARCLILVPVAPHTLASRAIVIGPEDEIEIVCPAANRSDICITVDGQQIPCRMALQSVRVRMGERVVRLLKLDGRDFYDVLRAHFFGA